MHIFFSFSIDSGLGSTWSKDLNTLLASPCVRSKAADASMHSSHSKKRQAKALLLYVSRATRKHALRSLSMSYQKDGQAGLRQSIFCVIPKEGLAEGATI